MPVSKKEESADSVPVKEKRKILTLFNFRDLAATQDQVGRRGDQDKQYSMEAERAKTGG